MYFVYILQSLRAERFYIGSTSDIARRLLEHNKGQTPSTKPYRPWQVIYFENKSSKPEANKREWHLKHPKGYLEKKAIIEQYRVRSKEY